jgi:hypothetical protein
MDAAAGVDVEIIVPTELEQERLDFDLISLDNVFAAGGGAGMRDCGAESTRGAFDECPAARRSIVHPPSASSPDR